MDPILFVEWYTDPFCSWSFAAEGPIEKFRLHFGDRLSFRHRLFPLYRQIDQFLKAHGMESQKEFAPKILNVSRATGVIMSGKVWENAQAPTSSEECCLFVEAALLSNAEKGGLLLSKMRQMAFLEGKNIGNRALTYDIADSLGLHREKIDEMLLSGRALSALNEDREMAEREGVTVRPTLILRNSGGDRVFIGGLRNPDLFILAGETLIQES